MHYDSDAEDFFEILEELIDEGLLVRNSPAHGAAKQCADRGFESLSRAQKFNYDTVIIPLLRKKACSVPNCDERVHQGFGLCSYHQSQLEKN